MSTDSIRIGHNDSPLGDTCGCCEGTMLSTVAETSNRPSLSAIAFRVGDHGRFKASMLAGLSSADRPALQSLGTRDDRDFSIALIDAWASVCDVLTFYQERLANEAYMQTATESLSVRELARLIGYRLHPGAAAEADLVLLMDDPPGAPPDVTDLIVPLGTRVQSQPGPEEEAQIFETIDPITTRVAWNTLRPRLNRRIVPVKNDIGTWLDGFPALQVGDAILIVGRSRSVIDPGSEHWDFRRLTSVTQNADLNRTYVTWDIPLGSVNPPGNPAAEDHQFFHLRDRAALFGFNAPHPAVLSEDQRTTFGAKPDLDDITTEATLQNSPSFFEGTVDDPGDWCFDPITDGQIHLDAIYKSFVQNGWVALTLPNDLVELYRIQVARDDNVAAYAISGKSTRLQLDTLESLSSFNADYRKVSVYGGSVEIPFADTPETGWVSGSEIELETLTDLPEGRKLIFQGKRAQVMSTETTTLNPTDGASRSIPKGTKLALLGPPEDLPATADKLWHLQDSDGFVGYATESLSTFISIPAEDADEEIAEVAYLSRVEAADSSHSVLSLDQTLDAAFDRDTLRIFGNVARAAHGDGATEILGGGDPSVPFQKFLLKQAPVTHRLAATETGVASTLTLQVDGVEWEEVPDLYDRAPTDRVFRTRQTDEGQTVVEFGDGVSGARPPAGRDNIVADYSKGLGLNGNLKSKQLSLPLDQVLGLREMTNPLPSTGGDDPETLAGARRNAPIYTLTLGRVVSISDYRDFALGFPGIAKAEAGWIWQGDQRRIVVTVAGPDGAAVEPGSTTHSTLLSAFQRLGDPLVAVDLMTFIPAFFRLGIRISVDPTYAIEEVLEAAERTLRSSYSFAQRDFAQSLALSDVAATAHKVPGVVAVDIDQLYRESGPQSAVTTHPLLSSRASRLVETPPLAPELIPAEILMLSPGPLEKLEAIT